jgi:hypothetical protein
MRAALIHVLADAAVSVLVIVGLLLARSLGWLWMDPLAGIAGACVISSWSFGLIRDTGAILLDMNPDRRMADNLKRSIEDDGDQLTGRRLPQRPRSADRTRSPVAVSQKREYFKYWPETIGCSGPEVANTRARRPPTNSQKPAIGGHFRDYQGRLP